MLRVGTIFAVALALSAAAPQPVSNNILELDLSPEEAQKYLNSPPFTEPQLSGRVNVLPLNNEDKSPFQLDIRTSFISLDEDSLLEKIKYDDPRFRSAEAGPTLGHYWRNGHEIENPDAYVEEVYNANQYHGQDGLGAYAYGYETPESAKVENRVRSGDVTGSYVFKDGNNELIKVRYWSDNKGFHQEDNIPKVVLKPVEEAEDVRQARIAHEKAWQEAAAAARQYPDPQGEYNRHYDYQPAASELSGAVVAPPGGLREAKAYNPQGSYETAPGFPSPQPEKYEEPEPTGPPRGFFYKFDYPVSIIVPKNPDDKTTLNAGSYGHP